LSNSTAVITAPDKHSQHLERKAAATAIPLTPVIHLKGFTLSEWRASLISPQDNMVEIYANEHLYKPEEIAKAEAQAATAGYLQKALELAFYKDKPEFSEKLELFIALGEAMNSMEKATWEKCYPAVKK
jgi:hypothetical protein